MGRLSKTPAVRADSVSQVARQRGTKASEPVSPGAAQARAKGLVSDAQIGGGASSGSNGATRGGPGDTLLGARAKLGTVEPTTRGEVLFPLQSAAPAHAAPYVGPRGR